jgi:hypothetical protein
MKLGVRGAARIFFAGGVEAKAAIDLRQRPQPDAVLELDDRKQLF